MHITEEKVSDQNALLKIKITPEDYSDKYNQALKQYRKQVSMPGFRPGKVPIGVVKKRYGKSLLAEELNKVLSDRIQKYITEKDLQVLGSPMPTDQNEDQGDWDNPSDFEFTYELGLAPDLKVNIDKKKKFEYFTIKVDDKLLDEQIGDIARRYGKLVDAENAKEKDMLVGDFVELDENDEIKEGGILNTSTIAIEHIDADVQKDFIGKKPGDSVVVDPHKVSRNHEDLERMLNISHEQVHQLSGNFQFNINEVKEMIPAEINQELFDKIFGEGEVQDEKEFRARVKDDIQKGFSQDSDRLFKRDITNKLIEDYNPTLPDDFLKRWIQMSNEKPITAFEVERDYDSYRKSLQWQLIFNDLIKQDEIKIEQDEVIDRAKTLLSSQYAQYGLPAPDDNELTETAMKVLANQDESRKLYDMLYDEKLVEYIRNNATVKDKEVAYDKFVELAQKG